MKKHLSIYLSLIVLLFFACHEETLPHSESDDPLEDPSFVDMSTAKGLASILEHSGDASSSRKGKGGSKNVKNITSIPDEMGKSGYYIINYDGAGFVIMSADKRVDPILAYSNTNNFDLNLDKLPYGLAGWLIEKQEVISDIRSSNVALTSDMNNSWDPCTMSNITDPLLLNYCGLGCKDEHTVVGPLMQSTWGQREQFNDLVQNINCPAGITPVGCVATAMGQIMKYYSYPSTYNWNAIPLGMYGSSTAAVLLKDIGVAVNMNYTCDGSGASMENATSAFSQNFGYNVASYEGFNYGRLKSQINSKRPVMLSGYNSKKQDCFLSYCYSTVYDEGHAWVCDGYRESRYCGDSKTYTFLHMNWGWSGSNNAWYAVNRWNPSIYNFQYKQNMIINIRP